MSQKKVLWFINWQNWQNDFKKASEDSQFTWEAASEWQDAMNKITWSRDQNAPFSVAFVDGFEKAEWIWKVDPNVQCVIWADSKWDWAQNFKKFDKWDKWIAFSGPFTQWEAWQAAKSMWRKWELECAQNFSASASPSEQRILVVDDENQIRDIVVEMLSDAGFKVFSASNGEEALKFFDDPSFKVDLLLTDIVMPKVTGIRLAESFGKVHPAVPVVFMSGFPRDSQFQRDVENGQKRFLQKPFSNDSLLRAVQDAFSGSTLSGTAVHATWQA